MNKIAWTPVVSSDIEAIAYDEQSSVLFVMFINHNRIYKVSIVNRELYDDFLSAPSKGKFYNSHFKKNNLYSVKKIM